jgi:hypothetical protein
MNPPPGIGFEPNDGGCDRPVVLAGAGNDVDRLTPGTWDQQFDSPASTNAHTTANPLCGAFLGIVAGGRGMSRRRDLVGCRCNDSSSGC